MMKNGIYNSDLICQIIQDFAFSMDRAWSLLCCHGNVTVDVSWNFVMRVTTVQSFSSVQKTSSCSFIPFFCDFTSFCVHNDISQVI